LLRKVPHAAVAVVGVVVGVLVIAAVCVDVAVGLGVNGEVRVGEGVESAMGVSVGVAAPVVGVGLRVGAGEHPFNAAPTALRRQSIVT